MENDNLKPVLYDKNKKMIRHTKNHKNQSTHEQQSGKEYTGSENHAWQDRQYTHYNFSSDHSYHQFENFGNQKSDATKKLNFIDKIFLKIAGADINLISQCPNTDIIRYSIIGKLLTIFLFYASFNIYHVFNKVKIFSGFEVIAYSLIVAIFIFMIDRFIINSFIVDPQLSFWSKLFNPYALSRLFMAVCIGLFVSIPMIMQIYNDAIKNRYTQQLHSEIDKINSQNLQNILTEKKLQDLNEQLILYKNKKSQLLIESDSLHKVYKKNFTRYLDKKTNEYKWRLNSIGSIAKNHFLKLQKTELPKVDSIIAQLEHQYNQTLQNKYEEAQKRKNELLETNQNFELGFVERFKILTSLIFADKYQTFLSILLILFLLSFELLPVLIKLIAPPTHYDIILYENYKRKLNESERTLLLQKFQIDLEKYKKQQELEKEKKYSEINKQIEIEKKQIEAEIEKRKSIHQKIEIEQEDRKKQINYDSQIEKLKILAEIDKLHLKKDLLFKQASMLEAEKAQLLTNHEIEKLKQQHKQEIDKSNTLHNLMIEKLEQLQDLELDKIRHKQNLEKIKDSEILEATIENVLNILNEISANLEKNIQSSGKIDIYDV
ncbi:MAG: hypothetical protein KatS3mg034_2092 [Vicingaceae bacterium]|nr:MAG: hypothetical protein KatS3mg034_2092 [Vicingaceae bacterium]